MTETWERETHMAHSELDDVGLVSLLSLLISHVHFLHSFFNFIFMRVHSVCVFAP